MASDMNKTFVIGRLTKDCELRYTQGGTSVTSLSIAVNRSFKAQNEVKNQVSFFNCVAWGKLGETMNTYCHKGDRIAIEGYFQQQSWTDKDGSKKSKVELIVEQVQFLSTKEQSNHSDQQTHEGKPVPNEPDVPSYNDLSDDEIPF